MLVITFTLISKKNTVFSALVLLSVNIQIKSPSVDTASSKFVFIITYFMIMLLTLF